MDSWTCRNGVVGCQRRFARAVYRRKACIVVGEGPIETRQLAPFEAFAEAEELRVLHLRSQRQHGPRTLFRRRNLISTWQQLCLIMASDFAEYCLHVRRLETRIACCAICIDIPVALMNFALVQLDSFDLLSTASDRCKQAEYFLLRGWLCPGLPMMLLAEFWEMWWNPFARNAFAENSKMSEISSQDLLEGNRRVVKRAFGFVD